MRAVVDRLQGLAPQPPGGVALGGRLRLGTGPARRGATVPDVAQPLAGISGPQGDQFPTPDVTGQLTRIYTAAATTTQCCVTFFIYRFASYSLTYFITLVAVVVVFKAKKQFKTYSCLFTLNPLYK